MTFQEQTCADLYEMGQREKERLSRALFIAGDPRECSHVVKQNYADSAKEHLRNIHIIIKAIGIIRMAIREDK